MNAQPSGFCAAVMGAGLYSCKAFLCSGGDVDRHYNPVILPGRGRASGECAVCAPATDGDTGRGERVAKTNTGAMKRCLLSTSRARARGETE